MADRIAHEPVERPLRVIAVEFALTAGQAYLVGLCLAIAAQQDGAPFVQIGLAAVSMGLVLAYALWLLGGSGLPMAVLNLPLLVLTVDLALVAWGVIDLGVGRIGLLGPELAGPVPPLLAALSAAAGVLCGLALPGPRRLRRGGARKARESVTASADLSAGAVMERLRTAEPVAVVEAPATAEAVWFDETGEGHPSELEPLEAELEAETELDLETELELDTSSEDQATKPDGYETQRTLGLGSQPMNPKREER
jgi:hypothetical protein